MLGRLRRHIGEKLGRASGRGWSSFEGGSEGGSGGRSGDMTWPDPSMTSFQREALLRTRPRLFGEVSPELRWSVAIPARNEAEQRIANWTRRGVPEDLAELLTNGLEEALYRGFLDDRRAVDMAVRRAELFIGENITLPLARDKDRVYWLMQKMEEEDWKGIVDVMTPRPTYE